MFKVVLIDVLCLSFFACFCCIVLFIQLLLLCYPVFFFLIQIVQYIMVKILKPFRFFVLKVFLFLFVETKKRTQFVNTWHAMFNVQKNMARVNVLIFCLPIYYVKCHREAGVANISSLNIIKYD